MPPSNPQSTPLPINPSLHIKTTPELGRSLTSTRSYSPGDLLFHDVAIVHGSSTPGDDFDLKSANLITAAFGQGFMSNVGVLIMGLSDVDCVGGYETAKCLVLLASVYALRERREFMALKEFWSDDDDDEDNMDTAADDYTSVFTKLTYIDALDIGTHQVKLSSELTAYRSTLISSSPQFPSTVTTNTLSNLVGKLNTNSLDLETIASTGLYPYMSITQHSCSPNASFSTLGIDLYLTCIAPIAVGDSLSIDYLNGYYIPTFERGERLKTSYGFDCRCVKCANVSGDFTRGFKCGLCNDGCIYVRDYCDSGEGFSKCSECGKRNTEQYEQECLRVETAFINDVKSVDSIEEFDALKVESEIDEFHHHNFALLSQLANDLPISTNTQSKQPKSKSKNKKTKNKAQKPLINPINKLSLLVHQRLLALLTITIARVHHEHVIYHDKLGQIALACGNRSLSLNYFKVCYAASVSACGVDNPNTLKIKFIVENLPNTLEELMLLYEDDDDEGGGGGMDVDGGDDGDGGEEWEDME